MKREHDDHDGIAENAMQWHSVGLGISSGALEFGMYNFGKKYTVKYIVKNSINNRDSKSLELGKYNAEGKSYLKLAQEKGYAYFQIEEGTWEIIKEASFDDIWKINRKVIDDAIKDGKTIRFSHDPFKYKNERSYFGKEIQYLQEKDYKFEPDKNGGWYAVKKK